MVADIEDIWVIDSGASRHITYRREWFTVFESCVNMKITLGDNSICDVLRIGIINIKKFVNNRWENGKIENLLYVPKLRKNLFSVGVITSRGYEVNFSKDEVQILKNGFIVIKGIKQENELFCMLFIVEMKCELYNCKHERLGHKCECNGQAGIYRIH